MFKIFRTISLLSQAAGLIHQWITASSLPWHSRAAILGASKQIYNFTRLGFDCLIAHKVTSPCMLNETPDQAWLSLSKHQMGPFSFKLCLNWIKLLHYLMWISACSQRTLPIFSDGSRRLEEHYPTQLVLQQQFSQNLQPAVQRWQEEVMFLAPYFRWPAAP